MRWQNGWAVAAAVIVSVVATQRAEAQGPALIIYGQGGGYSPLTKLDDAGTTKLKTGFSAGGGLGLQLNRYLAVRGDLTLAQSRVRENAPTLADEKFQHLYYGADLQLRYPTAGGFAPYVFVGAGAVSVKDKGDAGVESFTKFAGKGGIGAEYQFPKSGVGIFAQGTTWLYKFDRAGFDKTQADLLYTAGVSYRVRL